MKGRSTDVTSVQMSFNFIMKGLMCERKENRCQVTGADECKFDYHQVIVKTELDY